MRLLVSETSITTHLPACVTVGLYRLAHIVLRLAGTI
jgi:hypothetical protein